jgi:hypothetical protein
MSLTTRIRSEIYEKLVPLLGEENAEAMMAEFPATEHDQLVTREFLRAEMADLRTEMHAVASRNLTIMMGTVAGAIIGGMGLAAAIG